MKTKSLLCLLAAVALLTGCGDKNVYSLRAAQKEAWFEHNATLLNKEHLLLEDQGNMRLHTIFYFDLDQDPRTTELTVDVSEQGVSATRLAVANDMKVGQTKKVSVWTAPFEKIDTTQISYSLIGMER